MTEISDEMVRRALAAYRDSSAPSQEGDIRAALNAALNPPAEPEVVITNEMKSAGCVAYNDEAQRQGYRAGILRDQMAAAYHAMRRLEMKAVDPAPKPSGTWRDRPHYRKGDFGLCYFHRRSTDTD